MTGDAPTKPGFGIVTDPSFCLTVGTACVDNGTRTLAFDIAASMTRVDFSLFAVYSFSASQAYEDDTVCPECGEGVGLQNVKLLAVSGFSGETLRARETFEIAYGYQTFHLTDPKWRNVDRVVFQPLDSGGAPGIADVTPCCTVVLDDIEVAGPPSPPMISEGGVVLASLLPSVSSISPSSIISVFGKGLASEDILFPTLDANGDISKILAETCLEMNGARLPLFAVTPGQINAQASAAQALGPARFTVTTQCDTPDATVSNAVAATVEAASPAFFLFPPLADDSPIAARFSVDNAAVAPAGLFHDSFGPSRPAKPGDVIVLYGVGWGATTANLFVGQLATGAAEVLPGANPTVSFGGVVLAPEEVFYVGLTPFTAGLYQLALRVPAAARAGPNQLILTVYGKSTPTGPTVPVAAP